MVWWYWTICLEINRCIKQKVKQVSHEGILAWPLFVFGYLYVVLYFVINQHITLWGRKFQLGITDAQNFESNNPLVHVLYDVSTRFYFSYKTLIEFCRNCCCKVIRIRVTEKTFTFFRLSSFYIVIIGCICYYCICKSSKDRWLCSVPKSLAKIQKKDKNANHFQITRLVKYRKCGSLMFPVKGTTFNLHMKIPTGFTISIPH